MNHPYNYQNPIILAAIDYYPDEDKIRLMTECGQLITIYALTYRDDCVKIVDKYGDRHTVLGIPLRSVDNQEILVNFGVFKLGKTTSINKWKQNADEYYRETIELEEIV